MEKWKEIPGYEGFTMKFPNLEAFVPCRECCGVRVAFGMRRAERCARMYRGAGIIA